MSLNWNGQLTDEVAERLVPALDEIDMRIEARAKAELWPKHGKLTGTLQRGIHTQAARVDRGRVVGAIGTEPLPYALAIHQRYRFLIIGFNDVQPRALGIIEQHMRGPG